MKIANKVSKSTTHNIHGSLSSVAVSIWVAVDVNDQTSDQSVCLLCLLPSGCLPRLVFRPLVSMGKVGSTGSRLTFVNLFDFVLC